MNFLSRYCAGSLLNAHLHFHVVMIDGVFCEEDAGRLHFLETCLSAEQMAHLQRTIRQRIVRLYQSMASTIQTGEMTMYMKPIREFKDFVSDMLCAISKRKLKYKRILLTDGMTGGIMVSSPALVVRWQNLRHIDRGFPTSGIKRRRE